LAWIAAKNVVYPGRRLIARHFHGRHARFDRRAGIRTAGPVSLRELGLSAQTSVRYEASPIGFFHSLIRKLDIDYSSTVFIDLGSGKGSAAFGIPLPVSIYHWGRDFPDDPAPWNTPA